MKSLILTACYVTAQKDEFTAAFSYQKKILTTEIEQCKASTYEDDIKKVCESNARERAKNVCDMAYRESMKDQDFDGYKEVGTGKKFNFDPILQSIGKITRCYNVTGNGVWRESKKGE